MKLLLQVCIASLFLLVTPNKAETLDECLKKDSISCVQRSLYKRAKEFFDKESFEIVSGVSLVRAKNKDENGRSNPKTMTYEQEIVETNDVSERQNALENFVGEEVGQFFSRRSLQVSSRTFFYLYIVNFLKIKKKKIKKIIQCY